MKLIDIFKINITPKFTKEALQPLFEKEVVKPKLKEYCVELLDKNSILIEPPFTIKTDSMWNARQKVIYKNNCKSIETRATYAYVKELHSNKAKEWMIF